jgi:Tripartite tricarboxylate transporter family receptor
VRIVVGFAAGGAGDIAARLMGQWLSERLGQQFVVENRPGGNGNIAAEAGVRAPADGYALLMVSSANAANAARRKHARKLSHRGWAVASNRLALWARADRKIIQKLAKSEHRFARSVEGDLASFSAKGAQRRPRPPRPLSPSPVSPNAEEASPRACLCFVAALGQGMAHGIEPGPARPQLTIKASSDGSPDPPDPQSCL